MKLMKLAHIHRRTEPIWHVQLAILVAIAVQISLDKSLVIGPHYSIALIEFILLLAVSFPSFSKKEPSQRAVAIRHLLGICLLGLITMTNIASLILVTFYLLNGGVSDGHQLIYSALAIYATNIIVFGLLYWELDTKSSEGVADGLPRDFLFPQETTTSRITRQPGWQPTFVDYLYVSVTNATAFSPTDAMPLTYRAKALMTVQGFTALATVALVAARAVNLLR